MDTYEKKYKDALAWMRELYPGLHGATKEDAEHYFPELRESEDERMAEMAIKAVISPEAQSCIRSWGVNPDDVIAWLEKQKEQEHICDSAQYEEGFKTGLEIGLRKQKEQKEELVYRLNGLMQDYIKEGKDDEEKEHRLKCYKLFWDALEDTNFFEQKEQKRVEVRTPTDEEIEEARKQLHEFKVFVVKTADKHQVCFSYDHDFEWDNFCGEILYYLNGNQKPVEWSEEDEKMLVRIIERGQSQIQMFETGLLPEHIAWLKSLRPSWKPSEEQMKALEDAFRKEGDDNYRNIINSLYNDLKRL